MKRYMKLEVTEYNANLDDAQTTIAVFSVTVATTIAIIYYVIQIDINESGWQVIKTLFISFFILLLPQGYKIFATIY
jgi:hypothetical protein